MKKILSLFALLMTIVIGAKADPQTDLIDGITLPSLPSGTYTGGTEVIHKNSNKAVVVDEDGNAVMQASAPGYGSPVAANFTWANACNDGTDNSWSTSSCSWNAISSSVFVGSSAYNNSSNIHNVGFNRRYNLQNDRSVAYRFTNCGGISVAVKSQGTTDAAAAVMAVYEVSGTTQTAVASASSKKGSLEAITIEDLNKTKTYVAYIYGMNGSNGELYEVAFLAPSVEAAPSTPTFTVDGGAVSGGSTTTIASENAKKIYYAWTESATAPEKGDAAYSELSGASKAVTIPNVSGTKYLHAYGWNNYNEGSTSDIKSAEFTITKDVTAPKTWNFATDFSDETKTALETNFTYDEGNARYKSSTQIDKNTDTDLGTFAASAWSGLIIGRSSNITSGNLRIKENGYVQINGGSAYFKIKNLKDGDVINIRCQSANQTGDRTFTVTGATETTATAYAFYKGYTEFTLTKSGNGDLVLTQNNGVNVWAISVNEELPALTTTTEGITIGTEGVATYVTNNAIDFSGVTGLTAYTATSANNQYVFTEAVTGIVPANTALLVKGASATIPLVQATSTSVATLEGNILKASDGNKTGGDNIYAFSKSALKFKKVDSEVTIPSGKAYLVIESGEAPTALDIQFDGEATAVEAIAEAQAETAAPVKVIKGGKLYIGNYNVAGQLVK